MTIYMEKISLQPTMRYALKIAYDGSTYHGFARQPNLSTIEGALITTLKKHKILTSPTDAHFRIASRTDKKVSSLTNLICFTTTTSIKKKLSIINKEFTDIYCYAYTEVSSDFNPRHAIQRTYRYYLPKKNIDIDKLLNGAALFTGTHDFTNFARIETHRNPKRTIDNILIESTTEFYIIEIYAQTFLWQQIRRIIAALTKLGTNKIDIKTIKHALNHPNILIDLGIAPPTPLLLTNITYPLTFTYLKNYQQGIEKIKETILHQIRSNL